MLEIEQNSPWQIKTAIMFYSDVRLRHIVYRDTQNSTKKPQTIPNGHKILFRCPIGPIIYRDTKK